MRPDRLLFAVLLIVLAVAGCRGGQKRTEPIVLRVDDRSITRREFDRNLAPRLAARGNPAPNSSAYESEVQLLVREQIDEQLLLAEARKRGVTLDPGEVDREVERLLGQYEEQELEREMSRRYQTMDQWRESVARRLLLDRISAQIASEAPSPTESEIAIRYNAAPEKYSQPEMLSVSQILVRTESDASEVVGLLKKKSVPFEQVARDKSIAPEASKGGYIGTFAPGELPPELEEPVRTLIPGTISDVVRTSYGYHVFRLNEMRPAVQKSLADAHDQIAAEIRAERERDTLNAWLDSHRRAARIELVDDLLHEAPETRK